MHKPLDESIRLWSSYAILFSVMVILGAFMVRITMPPPAPAMPNLPKSGCEIVSNMLICVQNTIPPTEVE